MNDRDKGMIMSHADLKKAVLALKADGVRLGTAWDHAHELAQAHEGDTAFDRLHAFLHRIEDDQANAAYWYRRANEPVFDGDIKSECDVLIERWCKQT